MAETAQPIVFSRWAPSLPTNITQFLNPFTAAASDEPVKSSAVPKVDEVSTQDIENASGLAFFKRPILSAVAYGTTPSRQSSISKSSDSVMFAEPETPSATESGSRETSVDGGRRAKKSDRPKTRYSICHPPPTSSTRQKLHRRPRPLLQLHRLSVVSRPLPAYEIIPSANFNVRLTRAITKVFTSRHALCLNDLVVLQAESYHHHEDTDDEQEERNVIGLICKGRKDDDKTVVGSSRIYTAHGREWEAYTTPTGGYEFCSTDEHGLSVIVRWVPKRYKDESKAPKDGSRTFTFSTISPHTRRHPIIATLSKTSLEINDRYKMPDPAAATPLSTPQQHTSHLTDAMHEEHGSAHMYETDDVLRELITLTGIWVTFREGWSVGMKYDDKEKDCCSPVSPIRSAASDISSPPGSPLLYAADKRSSIKSLSSGILRRGSLLSNKNGTQQHNRLSIASATTFDPPSRSPSIKATTPTTSSAPTATGRARADSSSTVLVHRAASNRRKNSMALHGASSWRLSRHLDQESIVEGSREDLSRKSMNAERRSPIPPQMLAKEKERASRKEKEKDSERTKSSDASAEDADEEDEETDTTEDEAPSPEEREEEILPPPRVPVASTTRTQSLRNESQHAHTKTRLDGSKRKSGFFKKLLCMT